MRGKIDRLKTKKLMNEIRRKRQERIGRKRGTAFRVKIPMMNHLAHLEYPAGKVGFEKDYDSFGKLVQLEFQHHVEIRGQKKTDKNRRMWVPEWCLKKLSETGVQRNV